ncbi:MAG: hypothetical protein AAGA34_13175 [Pseudomonadota bacterium]
MFDETTLSALKYAGIFITALASVWALVTQTTRIDDHGKKRLTRAGWGSIAITLTAAGLTATAFWLDSDLQRKASVAKSEAQSEQDRMIERAAYPIGELNATVVFELKPDVPALEPVFSRYEEFGRRLVADPAIIEDYPGAYISSKAISADGQETPKSFTFYPWSELAPGEEADPELHYLLFETGAQLAASLSAQSVEALKADLATRDRARIGYFGQGGDYAFDLSRDTSQDEPTVTYDIDTGLVSLWINGSARERWTRLSGEVGSVPELERSRVFSAVDVGSVPDLDGDFPTLEAGRKALTMDTLFLSFAGKNYHLFGFEAVETSTGRKVWISKPVGETLED